MVAVGVSGFQDFPESRHLGTRNSKDPAIKICQTLKIRNFWSKEEWWSISIVNWSSITNYINNSFFELLLARIICFTYVCMDNSQSFQQRPSRTLREWRRRPPGQASSRKTGLEGKDAFVDSSSLRKKLE